MGSFSTKESWSSGSSPHEEPGESPFLATLKVPMSPPTKGRKDGAPPSPINPINAAQEHDDKVVTTLYDSNVSSNGEMHTTLSTSTGTGVTLIPASAHVSYRTNDSTSLLHLNPSTSGSGDINGQLQ